MVRLLSSVVQVPRLGLGPELEKLRANPTLRWTMRRKMAVILAIDAGLIDTEDALSDFSISVEELNAWKAERRQGSRTAPCGCVLPDGSCATCASIVPIQAKLARLALGWTFDEAAKKTGVSIRSLVRFESGGYLRRELVDKLRDIFATQGLEFPTVNGKREVVVGNLKRRS